jgi:adenylate cyclase
MATGDVKRKLTAIFSADVEGYSRLMGEDELATVETLTTYKETMGKLIRQYRGRVIDSTGDNLLAEFASVVDAVQCAVEVQQVLGSKNETLPENRRMYFRIGINLGDVLEEGERIYGDGVNVAARVESLAEGGGISISGTAYDQLGKKLPLGYEYLGEQTVKNIEKPVRVYRVLTEAEAAGMVIGEEKLKPKQWRGVAIGAVAVLIIVAGALAIWNFYLRLDVEPASVERMAFPLPDKPSIAVLPFVNMSEDPKQEYFSDGLTEEIITALSKVPKLFVIARNSSFSYKGKAVKVNQIAEELGVRYVLEGSVRIAGERVRITAQLIDALTGHHLWAERYDKDLRDIFDLQDEITMKVITELQVKLTEGDTARSFARGTDNNQAYLKYLQAREHFLTQTKEGNAKARRLGEEIIALDPEFPAAYTLLGMTHFMEIWYQTSKSPRASIRRAFELARKALALDESHPMALRELGLLYTFTGEHDKAIIELERALALDPNSSAIHIWMSMALRFAGRFEEAVTFAEQSIRLNPIIPPGAHLRLLANAYRDAGRYEEAITAYKKALNRTPNDIMAHLMLAAAFSMAGRIEEARAEAEQVLKINPKFSLEYFAKRLTYKNKADKDRVLNALRNAGLPETPPLPLPDKPSIAVLPFVNMSGEPEQEYFSDGITEEIITALSKIQEMFVIARTSSFKYKGKEVDVRTVGRELGVRYVLEGTVRKSRDQLRITAQLIDAKTGNHLWAERYERELKDIFAIQDEITMKIITELQVKLTSGEQARLAAKGTDNFEAYLKVLQAAQHFVRMNKEDNAIALKMAEEAIALDPKYPRPYAVLGWARYMEIYYRTSKSPKQSVARAIELAQKSLEMDPDYAGARSLLCHIYTSRRQYEKAIAEGERAVAIEPSFASGYVFLARSLHWAGRNNESIPLIKKAIRLNPYPPSYYYYILGQCYIVAGKFEEAVAETNKAVQIEPNSLWARVTLASSYGSLGREEEARAASAEVLRIDPNFSVDHFAKRLPYKRQPDKDRFIGGLRKAGLK